MKSRIILIAGIVIALVSCQDMGKANYVNWVRTHLKQEVNSSPFRFEALHKPGPYVVLLQEGKDILKSDFEQQTKALEGMLFFDLKISMEDRNADVLTYQTSSKAEKQERLNYFSFDFQKAIYLDINGEKIPCSRYHFEHSYDLTNERSFVIGFETPASIENMPATIRIESAAFGTEAININFNQTAIPTIAI